MIMLVFVLALNSAQAAVSGSTVTPSREPVAALGWCDSVYTVALATARAKAAGMSRQEAETAVAQLPSSEARIAGARVVMMAYDMNAAGQISPEQFAGLVRSGCLQAEPDSEPPAESESPTAPASATSTL